MHSRLSDSKELCVGNDQGKLNLNVNPRLPPVTPEGNPLCLFEVDTEAFPLNP